MKWDDKGDEYISDAKSIKGFAGDNRWLSNFWPCTVFFEGMRFLSSEAAYQAAKTRDMEERTRFQVMGAGTSKKEGRKLVVRDDWDDVKLQIMYDIVLDKFSRNPDLMRKLIETGDKHLEETNWWGDTYWGVCKGVGTNHLGRILMEVREFLTKATNIDNP